MNIAMEQANIDSLIDKSTSRAWKNNNNSKFNDKNQTLLLAKKGVISFKQTLVSKIEKKNQTNASALSSGYRLFVAPRKYQHEGKFFSKFCKKILRFWNSWLVSRSLFGTDFFSEQGRMVRFGGK